MKCGRTDPSAAERPSVGCGRSGRDRLCSVIVGVFGTRLALFGISPKLPEYLPRTLARVHAHHQQGRMHTEHVQMFITNLGKDNILLGTDWLKYHNPSIGWRRHEVHFDQCPRDCQQLHRFTKAWEEPSRSDWLARLCGKHIQQWKKL